jgi:hypothetical protein
MSRLARPLVAALLIRAALLLVCEAVPADTNVVKCNREGADSTACFVESRLIANSSETLILSRGSGALISGVSLLVVIRNPEWPNCSVSGGPGSQYSNGFHSQSISFTCNTNCCPSNGAFVNNFLYPNSTVTYLCATPAVVIPLEWTVRVTIVGTSATTTVGRMDSINALAFDERSVWCVPTQSGSYAPSELQFLTPPFLVPLEYIDSSVRHIGITQSSFADSFNCSQPRGYLTSLTPNVTLYDQFAPFRTTNVLTKYFTTNTTTATYVGSTYDDTSGLLQSTLRLMGPVYVLFDRSIGIPKPMQLTAPLLAMVQAAVVDGFMVVQLVPSYRNAAPPSELSLVVACTDRVAQELLCDTITVSNLDDPSTFIPAVCVQERPAAWSASWAVVSNRSIVQVLPQAPLVASVPLRIAPLGQTCRIDLLSMTSFSFITVIVLDDGTTSSTQDSLPPGVEDWKSAPQRVLSGPCVFCTLGLDEVLLTTSMCAPISDDECRGRYSGARSQYDTDIARCVPATGQLLPLSPQQILFSLSDTTPTPPTPLSSAPLSPAPSPPVAAFPWMTASWRLSINTTSICGAHGVWNESTWWCDCSAGWGTDNSQDPWSATSYTWCGTLLQWLTASPGAWDDSSDTVLSFVTAWVDRLAEGDAKTTVVTLIGLLVVLALLALILQGLWVLMGPAAPPRPHRQARRVKHRRRKRRGRLIEGCDVPLQIMWHQREPFEHEATASSSGTSRTARVHVATREEIELGSVFSSTSDNCTEATTPTTTSASSGDAEVRHHRHSEGYSQRRSG